MTQRTLLDQLERIDFALTDGNATARQEKRGQAIVTLANASPKMLAALKFALPYMEDLAASSDNKGERRAAKLMRQAIAAATDQTLPPDPENRNGDRAASADSALRHFRRITRTDYEDALGDLLCNLMHWSDRNNFDFDAALARASMHYEVETAGGEP